jgi:uncharacterized membrane protein (UPF0136 family)
MTQIATISLLIVGLLVFAGGLMGFIKGKSKASLIAGSISGALLVGCYFLASGNPFNGFAAAFVILCGLDFVFLKRFKKTKAFMPSGLMLVISVIEQLVLVGAFLTKGA